MAYEIDKVFIYNGFFCRGNTGILCKSVLESIDRGGVHFVDLDSTSCITNQTFNWFMSTDSIPLRQLVRMKQLQVECPSIPGHGNCTCDAERMTYKVCSSFSCIASRVSMSAFLFLKFSLQQQMNGQQLEFAAKVDCSGLGLTELPKDLPMMTMTLNVSNNNVCKAFQTLI